MKSDSTQEGLLYWMGKQELSTNKFVKPIVTLWLNGNFVD